MNLCFRKLFPEIIEMAGHESWPVLKYGRCVSTEKRRKREKSVAMCSLVDKLSTREKRYEMVGPDWSLVGGVRRTNSNRVASYERFVSFGRTLTPPLVPWFCVERKKK